MDHQPPQPADGRRYPTKGRSIKTTSTTNPYQPPPTEPIDTASGTSNLHTWSGREISVQCRAAAITLWMETTFIVTIDDENCYRQRALRWGDTFHFTFRHESRQIRGNVARDLGLFAKGMKYVLTVDGVRVAKSQTPIQNWHLGVVSIILGVLAFYAMFLVLS